MLDKVVDCIVPHRDIVKVGFQRGRERQFGFMSMTGCFGRCSRMMIGYRLLLTATGNCARSTIYEDNDQTVCTVSSLLELEYIDRIRPYSDLNCYPSQ